MTLNTKVFLIVGVTALMLIVAIHFLSRTLLLGSFAKIEERHVRQNMQRVLSALDRDIVTLDTFLYDWSAWDDTYRFAADNNEAFVAANLVDSTFTDLRLSFILVYDLSGQILFARGFDLAAQVEAPLPEGLEDYLDENNTLLEHSDVEDFARGIVALPEGPVVLAARPILTSDKKGPPRGTLIMGRYWNNTEINQLSQTTHMPLRVVAIDASPMPKDFANARTSLSRGTSFYVHPSSEISINGFTRVSDIYGTPQFLLKTETPRAIYLQAKDSLSYYLLSTALIGLLICALVYVLLKRLVVDRLALLATDVRRIDISSAPEGRVVFRGSDEVAFLGGTINKMLGKLAVTHQELHESLEQIKTLRGIVPICAHCKKVKDSQGYWHQVEIYVRDHTEAVFSHGLCESCIKEFYPEEITKTSDDGDD